MFSKVKKKSWDLLLNFASGSVEGQDFAALLTQNINSDDKFSGSLKPSNIIFNNNDCDANWDKRGVYKKFFLQPRSVNWFWMIFFNKEPKSSLAEICKWVVIWSLKNFEFQIKYFTVKNIFLRERKRENLLIRIIMLKNWSL